MILPRMHWENEPCGEVIVAAAAGAAFAQRKIEVAGEVLGLRKEGQTGGRAL
ncbi:MAG: hypothetical protein AB4911_16970 [Oscillochloridaceae bacterium umkhey_bin13]